jgi:uncharacterized protein YjbJ (UPF0337 family)
MRMNADIFEGRWKQIRGRADRVWGKLSDDDLARVDGTYDRRVGTLQETYGYTRAEAQDEVDAEFGGN